jgi:hypothetical protein
MKPVYFPFTYVSPALAERLRPFFPSLAVYQPIARRLPDEMRRLQSQGFLEVVAPDPGDDERLESVSRQFLDWGALHRPGVGIRAANSAGPDGGVPMFDEEASARIAAEVKRGTLPADEASGSEGLVAARLFLHLAQEFDRQSQELEGELEGLDQRRAALFAALRGRAGVPFRPPGPGRAGQTAAHAGYLTGGRVNAWARLYLSRPYPSPVFVTDHPDAAAQVLEKIPSAHRVAPGQGELPALGAFCADGPPSGDLMAELLALAAESVRPAAAADDGGGLRGIYVLPGVAPHPLWAGFAPGGAAGERTPETGPGSRNTLLVVATDRG